MTIIFFDVHAFLLCCHRENDSTARKKKLYLKQAIISEFPALLKDNMFWLLISCSEKEDKQSALPEEEEYVEVESTEPSYETEPSGEEEAFDEIPQLMLHLNHTGIWNLAPIAGPYTSMYGAFKIQELINGNNIYPYCDFSFAVTGIEVETLCPTCDFGFAVEFFISEPEPPEEGEEVLEVPEGFPIAESIEDCFTPELPEHQEMRVIAYSITDQMLYFDYFNTGIWVPWYPATFINDTLEVYYNEEFGFYGVGDD